jgi:hypothetical protein
VERRYAVVSIHATVEESALEVERIVKLPALVLTDRNPGLLVCSVLRKTLVTDDTQGLLTDTEPSDSVAEPWRESTVSDW